MNKYSQGVMQDGPVILDAGNPMTPEMIVSRLNHMREALQRIEKWRGEVTDSGRTFHMRSIAREALTSQD